MIVFVSEQLDHQLKEPANFRNFSIEIAAPRDRLRELSRLLKDVVDFADESSAWVCASGLQAMSSLGEDATWRAELGRMIEKARPHGWIRDVPKLAIKAHIDWVGSGASHQQR
jgi:hypothetical protein